MSENPKITWLHAVLAELGVRTTDGISPWTAEGYPVAIALPDGEQMIIDLPEPGLVSNLDPKSVGVVVTDGYGKVKKTWGIASRLDHLSVGKNLLDSPLTTLIESASTSGEGGVLYHEGYRYYSASARAGHAREVFLLVCDAGDEAKVRQTSAYNARSAELFKRIGKALATHQTLEELATYAVHEIASALGLAAIMLWVKRPEDARFTLQAHVGVNRKGLQILHTLEPESKVSCAAELVAMKRQPFWVPHVSENLLTSQLEARICYFQPRSIVVLPLILGDKQVGILELVSRDGDTIFMECKDLFETLAEHLVLALNTAFLFESVERMASFDPMTGVANHRAMQDFLHARLSESERNGTEVGVVMVDVDHFRAFNEEEGHDAGDFVLKEVAKALQDSVRPYDLAARYGGEEFTAILPGLDLSFSMEVAERIRRNIEKIEYTSPNGRTRHVTASFGVSSFPGTAKDAASLLKAADIALFRAKRAGRNRVLSYEGVFTDEQKGSELEDSVWIEKWQSPEDKTISQAYVSFLSPYADFISRTMMLSKAQSTILENLIAIYPTYRRLMLQNDPDVMRKLELAGEFRPLLPSLMTMGERFDGEGPMKMKAQKIPLLARVMAVLIVLVEDKGEPLVRDPGRFDPEIIALITDVSRAA